MSAHIIPFRLGCFCISSAVSEILLYFMLSPTETSFWGSMLFVCLFGVFFVCFSRKITNVQLGRQEECVNSLVLTWNVLLICLPDMRGFMTAHGQPDQPRSARYVLKDYVNVSSFCICVFLPDKRWTEGFTPAWRITIKWILFLWIKSLYIKILLKSHYFNVLNKWNHDLFKRGSRYSGNETILFSWVNIWHKGLQFWVL